MSHDSLKEKRFWMLSENTCKNGFVPLTDRISGQTKFVLLNTIEESLKIKYSELKDFAIESVR
jgi:hypothetical protein